MANNEMNVTAAFQQHLEQRRKNIKDMFKNPEVAMGDIKKAEDDEELDETEKTEKKEVKKGCGTEIKKEKSPEKEMDEEIEDEEGEDDEKTARIDPDHNPGPSGSCAVGGLCSCAGHDDPGVHFRIQLHRRAARISVCHAVCPV